MKEHPILFSTAMVQAILAGNKTMTRREVKQANAITFLADGFTPEFVAEPDNGFCPYGKVGDRLWVRETYQSGFSSHVSHCGYLYKATAETDLSHHWNWAFVKDDRWTDHYGRSFVWKPSIFMTKAAARIWLEVTEVRVERLQDISEEDAKAEGVKLSDSGNFYLNYRDQRSKVTQFIYNCVTAKQSFRTLWEQINGWQSYRDNPWVWVISFKVLSTTGKPE